LSKREAIPVDASALATFHKMVANMKSGGGVSFVFDKNEETVVSNDTLTTVMVPDDEDLLDGTSDDNNNEEDEEE